jgi:two-component system, sporulation sensor kinase C
MKAVAIPVMHSGRWATQIVLVDLTEEKRAMEQIQSHGYELERQVTERTEEIHHLLEQQAVLERVADTGRMAARIAHEINNPLAGIKNSIKLVRTAVAADHKYYSYVGRIEREVERVSIIVRQMFDIYRKEELIPVVCRPSEVVDDVVATMIASPWSSGKKLEVSAAAASEEIVVCESAIRRILINLIQNALEASPVGGSVSVTAETSGDRLRIAVKDQGPGIGAELQTQVFEPFFSTKAGPTTSGLGLGLSISRGLAISLGGGLSLESAPGRGATFTLTVPFKRGG